MGLNKPVILCVVLGSLSRQGWRRERVGLLPSGLGGMYKTIVLGVNNPAPPPPESWQIWSNLHSKHIIKTVGENNKNNDIKKKNHCRNQTNPALELRQAPAGMLLACLGEI